MSFEEVWPQLVALRCIDAPATTRSWKVLFARRSQPLLLPSGDPAQADAAVAFFIGSRAVRRWAKVLLWLDRWLPDAGLLPEVRLDHFPVASVFASGHCGATALLVGSPGPLQKLTMLCSGSAGEAPQVAKIALHASADAAAAREAHWLRVLGEVPVVADFLPRLLDEGVLGCGRRFVVMSALPDGTSTLRFEERHRQFLVALAEMGGAERWTMTSAVSRLRLRLRSVRSVLGLRHLELLEGVLAEVEAALERRALPACLMHGDFAPWNVRLTPERLFVFDWEYAQTRGNPLQDYLHFHLMPRVLHPRRTPVGPAFMRDLLANAAAYARGVFGEDSGVAAAAGTLAAHYLLDTITFYIEASGYLEVCHPVIRAYLRLLEKRGRWAAGEAARKGDDAAGKSEPVATIRRVPVE